MTVDRVDRLVEAAARWRDADPDPRTRGELIAMIERRSLDALEDHVGRRLEFGTAGIRGPLGAGPGRMNRLTVRLATTAIAAHLTEVVPDAAARGVVVGGDARHGSKEFVDEATAVLADRGVAVHRFDGPVPTPLAVFAVTALGAAAGIVVTASHNPRSDNGMKVVWSDGAQIVAPTDAAIGAIIDDLVRTLGSHADDHPGRTALGDVHRLGTGSDAPVVQAYVARAGSLVVARPLPPVRVAITALHGVGASLAARTFAGAADVEVHWVASQRDPDPDFPTVGSPNPEEPGTLAAVIDLAEEVHADVAFALDPDADRLAVVVPDGGAWRALTGDETGALLLHHLLDRTSAAPDRLVATTIVSSRLAERMCAAAGVHFAETPTGFKWLCRPGLAHPEWLQVLLYEEALGYGVGPDARDKDGITAALVVVELVAALGASGRSAGEALDDLAREHGAFVSLNGWVRLDGAAASEHVGARLALLGDSPPAALGGVPVVRADRPAPGVTRLLLDDDTRVLVRPSGTEPRVKYYCEAVEAVVEDGPTAARTRARRRLAPVVAEVESLLA